MRWSKVVAGAHPLLILAIYLLSIVLILPAAAIDPISEENLGIMIYGFVTTTLFVSLFLAWVAAVYCRSYDVLSMREVRTRDRRYMFVLLGALFLGVLVFAFWGELVRIRLGQSEYPPFIEVVGKVLSAATGLGLVFCLWLAALELRKVILGKTRVRWPDVFWTFIGLFYLPIGPFFLWGHLKKLRGAAP
jgi:hypothetical protein